MNVVRMRDESGATALLAGILAAVLFGLGAIVVDVGQAWAKRSLLQTSVDLAVMAATAELTQEDGCNTEVVATAKNYLNTKVENAVSGQYPIDLTGSFGDGDGFIECRDWKVTLEAPASRVDYGLARVVSGDEDHVDVAATATAQVKAPRIKNILPMYIAESCIGSSSQVALTDPPNGNKSLTPPDFVESPATLTTRIQKITPDDVNSEDLSVLSTIQIKLQGSTTFALIEAVVFTSSDLLTSITVPVSSAANTVDITLPAQVKSTEGVWWVRLRSSSGEYSPRLEAKDLALGDLAACNNSLSGNFGTVRLARTDPSNEMAMNIIKGAEPLLQTYEPSTATTCPTAQSETHPTSPTDCLSTDPGFPIAALTDGLLEGVGLEKGRLDVDTRAPCSRAGNGARTGSTPAVNDDRLICYITDPAVGLSAVLKGGSAVNALSADILKAPRFFYIPKFNSDPANGASRNYPIADFLPVFITLEPSPTTGLNGVSVKPSNGQVTQLVVTFIAPDAMPETLPAQGGETDYTGVGPKVIVLVD